MDFKRNCRPRPLRTSLSVLLLAAGGAPSIAVALDFGYSLAYGLEYTDNAQLTADNTQDEWTNTARAGFSLSQSSPVVAASMTADAQHNTYKNNTFPDETLYDLNLLGTWNISPERFSWTVEDYFNQTTILPNAPRTPNNRQNSNVASTGPDFILRMSPVQTLDFNARYARNTYDQTSYLASTRTSGNAQWAYQSTPATTFSLNLGGESVNYDNQQVITNVNFVRKDAFLEATSRLARNEFLLDIGRSRIHRDNVPEDETGGLGRFSVTREISSTSRVAMYASSQLTDVGQQALVRGQTGSQGPLQPTAPIQVVTAGVYRAKSIDLLYSFQRTYGSNEFRVFRQKNEFDVSLEDEDHRGGGFDIGYDFSQALSASISGSYESVEKPGLDPKPIYRDKIFGLRFVNQFNNQLYFGLALVENRRDSNNVAGTNEYTEHRGLLTITYSTANRYSRSFGAGSAYGRTGTTGGTVRY